MDNTVMALKVLAGLGYFCSVPKADGSFEVTKLNSIDLADQVAEIVRYRKGKIPAIRHVKIVTGWGLAEAKNYVEREILRFDLGYQHPDGYIAMYPEYTQV